MIAAGFLLVALTVISVFLPQSIGNSQIDQVVDNFRRRFRSPKPVADSVPCRR